MGLKALRFRASGLKGLGVRAYRIGIWAFGVDKPGLGLEERFAGGVRVAGFDIICSGIA